jgi:hypothetical protein
LRLEVRNMGNSLVPFCGCTQCGEVTSEQTVQAVHTTAFAYDAQGRTSSQLEVSSGSVPVPQVQAEASDAVPGKTADVYKVEDEVHEDSHDATETTSRRRRRTSTETLTDHTSGTEEWITVFQGDEGSIEACLDGESGRTVRYRARVNIPVSMTMAMAVGNEVQFMPIWNPLVQGEPLVLGERSAERFVLNYRLSAAKGLYKVEVLNEIERTCDEMGGYVRERVVSLDSTHPQYRKPASGYKATKTELQNTWFACGEECTVFVQLGKLDMPFKLTGWVLKTLGSIAGRVAIRGFVKQALLATEPKSKWEACVAEDRFGLYERLDRCVRSSTSQSRAPTKNRPISSIVVDVLSEEV